MDIFLKVLGIILAVVGAVIVYGAKFIVNKYGLDKRETVNIEGIDDEALGKLKMQKAIAKIKGFGGLIFLPGMILLLIAFR